jgi:hypothetical protein
MDSHTDRRVRACRPRSRTSGCAFVLRLTMHAYSADVDSDAANGSEGAARSDSVALQTTARLTKFRLRSARNQYFSKNSDTSDM